MGQFGFFDANDRLEALSAKGDPLEAIDALVLWESFRKAIEAVVLTPVAEKKNNAGRKPIDAIGDVPHADPAIALQSIRRSGGVSGARPSVVHAVPQAWH
jgi:hypothetical protein